MHRGIVLLACALAAASCGKEEEPRDPGGPIGAADMDQVDADSPDAATEDVVSAPADEVIIDPARRVLKTGESFRFTATVLDDGVEVDAAVEWTSTEPDVASVDETGLVTAGVQEGSTVIRAAVGFDFAEAEVTVIAGFALVRAGGDAACALTAAGSVYCWGQDLGETAIHLVSAEHDFVDLAVGGRHACAVDIDGSVWCWGTGDRGQLGTSDASAAAPVQAVTGDYVAVAAGDAFTCAITDPDTTGEVVCWGDNTNSQLGTGAGGAMSSQPVGVDTGTADTWLAISAGDRHVCGRTSSSAVLCWGADGQSQLGPLGTGPSSADPLLVSDAMRTPAAKATRTCAREGAWKCWGTAPSGLAQGAGPSSRTPVEVPQPAGEAFTVLRPGGDHACSLTTAGGVYCWGDNSSGQLGDGGMDSRLDPQPVAGMPAFVGLDSGRAHSCGVTVAGDVFCWGDNQSGQLGDTTGGLARTPRVVAPD